MLLWKINFVLLTVAGAVILAKAFPTFEPRDSFANCCHNCDDNKGCQVTYSGTLHFRLKNHFIIGVSCGDHGFPNVVKCRPEVNL